MVKQHNFTFCSFDTISIDMGYLLATIGYCFPYRNIKKVTHTSLIKVTIVKLLANWDVSEIDKTVDFNETLINGSVLNVVTMNIIYIFAEIII